MESNLEVLFTPAEFSALQPHGLAGVDCVVFDVLRATSSMLTALANGALKIYPVGAIADALALRGSHPGALLAGERDGCGFWRRKPAAWISTWAILRANSRPNEWRAGKSS